MVNATTCRYPRVIDTIQTQGSCRLTLSMARQNSRKAVEGCREEPPEGCQGAVECHTPVPSGYGVRQRDTPTRAYCRCAPGGRASR